MNPHAQPEQTPVKVSAHETNLYGDLAPAVRSLGNARQSLQVAREALSRVARESRQVSDHSPRADELDQLRDFIRRHQDQIVAVHLEIAGKAVLEQQNRKPGAIDGGLVSGIRDGCSCGPNEDCSDCP